MLLQHYCYGILLYFQIPELIIIIADVAFAVHACAYKRPCTLGAVLKCQALSPGLRHSLYHNTLLGSVIQCCSKVRIELNFIACNVANMYIDI